MKAGILDPVATSHPSTDTITGASGRPHLVLVPTGREAVGQASVGATPPARPPLRPPLRLTPFGRLVFALLAAVALALLLSVLAGSLASASGEAQEITVRAGQTLSGIAAEHLPEVPIRDAVVELQVFNGLSSSNIHVGQTLRIPSP
jgi:hypothetical protein